MEVPAKRARLAPRELKLVDLDDDALIMIIKKLDHKSKKQMMATCKRFERLIGQTHQFYKNFKLNWNELRTVAKAHHCSNIQRKFGSVNFFGSLFISQDSRIMEVIKSIGANVIEVHLDDLETSDTVFLEMMKLLSNLRELTISGSGNLYESRRSKLSPDSKLTNLIKLDINEPKKILEALVPDSLKILKIGSFSNPYQPYWDAAILGKQTGLEELSLIKLQIDFSGFDAENCHIKKLEIGELSFLDQISFKKFTDFLKMQESVVELELNIDENKLRAHDYAGTMTHLLNLKSLKKLHINCYNWNGITATFSKSNFCNPAVDSLSIKNTSSGADLKKLPKFFPNVTDMKIHDGYYSVDLQPINSMKQIRKLDVEYMSEQILVEFQLNQMRELIISRSDRLTPLAIWKTFINNNCQLEIFHMKWSMPIEHLLVTLENLPLLKSLEFKVDGFIAIDVPAGLCRVEFLARYKKEQLEKAAKLIGQNYDRLEHLKLDFYGASEIERNILDFLGKYYPGVKLQK
jgi:hypothetical protein